MGSVEVTVPSKPRAAGPSWATTPATSRAHAGSARRRIARRRRRFGPPGATTAGSSSDTDRRVTGPTPSPRTPATVVPRSMAMGRARPPA